MQQVDQITQNQNHTHNTDLQKMPSKTNTNLLQAIDDTQEITQTQQVNHPNHILKNIHTNKSVLELKPLKKFKSNEELQIQFKENQKALTTLNSDIDDLFKKISQLKQETLKEQSQQLKIQQKNTNAINITNTQQTQINPQQNIQQQIQPPLSMIQFQTGKTLGYGKFGQVLECRHLASGMIYALKKIFKSTVQEYFMENQILIELISQKRMDHPNIVKAYKAFTDPFHIFIIMQFVQGVQLVKKFKSSEQQVSFIIKQVLQAVKYIHSQGIVHRDLKPQNIIVGECGTVKICDFGWASMDKKELNIMCGTLDYLSPEMAQKKQYCEKVDLWSIGVLTYELIFGMAPFKGQNKAQTIEKIKSIQLLFPSEVSNQCKDFIKGFLKQEQERQCVDWGLEHPFITKFEQKLTQLQFDCL